MCAHTSCRVHTCRSALSLWFQLNTKRHIRRKLPSGALVLRAIDHSVSVSALAMCPAHLCSSCCLCLFGSTSHVFIVSFPLFMPFFPPFYRVAASAFRNLVVPAMILALHVVSCVAMLSLECHKRDPPHLIWPCCVCMRFRTQKQRWTRTVQYFCLSFSRCSFLSRTVTPRQGDDLVVWLGMTGPTSPMLHPREKRLGRGLHTEVSLRSLALLLSRQLGLPSF